jgi:SAM-dependent MidA family methyltransferase
MAGVDEASMDTRLGDVLRERCGGGATLRFDAFMELALYHPEHGYYRRAKPRVGTERGTDFFTASSTGPLFGELVAAAARKLLAGRGAEPGDFTFVEIGAEPGGGVLQEVAHGFGGNRVVRVGEEAELAGPCVVFSNELFDAQPFRRFLGRAGRWVELGVALDAATGGLVEVELGPVSEPWLPMEVPEGCLFDAPRAAAELAGRLAAPGWRGLFIAFDYGKSLASLLSETPAGTARAYHRHRQEKDLLARPGEQDLTCHVCWDWLSEALEGRGFGRPALEVQEAFFVRHAGELISSQVAEDGARLTPRKRALMMLLHPGNLGRKFQVLHAWRG